MVDQHVLSDCFGFNVEFYDFFDGLPNMLMIFKQHGELIILYKVLMWVLIIVGLAYRHVVSPKIEISHRIIS